MRWIEATINTQREEIETICTQLEALGVQGLSIEDEEDLKRFLQENKQYWDYIDESLTKKFAGVSRVKFYLIDDIDGHQNLKRIQNEIYKEIKTTYVDDSDWNDTWKQNFQPIEIGEKLVILPEWITEIQVEADRIKLRLEPGMAFGTGNHPTTRMCLAMMQKLDLKEKRALDLGCGSGILSIAALLLGCNECAAIDIDSNAKTATMANASMNQIEGELKVSIGNILTDKQLQKNIGGNYDLVMANIVADVILSLSRSVRQYMRPEGWFICSGIIENRAEEVRRALRENGLEIMEALQEEEWCCYLCRCRRQES